MLTGAMTIWTGVKTVLGFMDKPGRWWAWTALFTVIVFCLSFFFISYSLARHKKMVRRLTVEVQALRSEVKMRDLRIRIKDEEIKLAKLQEKDEQNEVKRKEIRKEIENINHDVENARKDLQKKRKEIKDKLKVDELIVQAKQLIKDTL